jgi:uncharacterized membrane protein
MGVQILLLVVALIVPATSVLFGVWFVRKPPKNRNLLFGYRTKRSLKSDEAWAFANRYCGRLWVICGLIELPVTLLVFFLTRSFVEIELFAHIMNGLIFAQLIVLLAAIPITERALKRKFGK